MASRKTKRHGCESQKDENLGPAGDEACQQQPEHLTEELRRQPEPLTEEQRRLVRENIGLVGVHLRRHLADLAVPRRDREGDDLFQEGCLGLVQAARRFDPEGGIAFPAYALPRIHKAVSKALYRKFATVRVPPKRRSKSCGETTRADKLDAETAQADKLDAETAQADESRAGKSKADKPPADDCEPSSRPLKRPDRPVVSSLTDELSARLADRRHGGSVGPWSETIDDRLRLRYERAVSLARDTVSKGGSTRGDRDALVRILVEERFLVPGEESRRPFRQIARETRSSYARVAEYGRQIAQAIGRTLQADPEFRELLRWARTSPRGGDTPIDQDFQFGLAAACTDEFVERFRRADSEQQTRILHALLRMSPDELEDLVRTRFASLPPAQREQLLEGTADLAEPP